MDSHSPISGTSSELVQRVAKTIDRHKMFSAEDHVLVGVSGGPDSTALLHILVALARHYRIRLAVVHLNHGIRGEAADRDAAFVRRIADALKLPFHGERAVIQRDNGSIEEQARDARYGFFRRVMAEHGFHKLALGHHKDDNAEAVLMHLLRGSGIRGLGGIPPVRDQWVVRPLIDLQRIEILDWLETADIAYVEDATNADPSYERNRIRHHLIPLLAETYNANVVDTLHRTADLCREEDAWLKRHLQPVLTQIVTLCTDDRLEIHLKAVSKEPLAAQRRLIREALAMWHGHLRRMTVHHIDALIGLLPEGQQGKRISLPFFIEAERRTTHLRFNRKSDRCASTEATPSSFYYRIPEEGDFPLTLDLPEAHCRLVFETAPRDKGDEKPIRDENQAIFDLDALSLPICIRNFRHGDRIFPFGMQGSQKIKKIFIDRKIPASRRRKIPLIESDGEIIWIAGVRRANSALLTQASRRILKIRLERYENEAPSRQWPNNGDEPENHA